MLWAVAVVAVPYKRLYLQTNRLVYVYESLTHISEWVSECVSQSFSQYIFKCIWKWTVKNDGKCTFSGLYTNHHRFSELKKLLHSFIPTRQTKRASTFDIAYVLLTVWMYNISFIFFFFTLFMIEKKIYWSQSVE